ncbi:MAG TPA: ATP-dependent helicase HrpB [Blastocatellia bacterium]|nr:ATP-dependent helicase HrpB [Blastocatellia bacterium]HMZ19402.1 ATP-dependent helicase HrpB [Blastocatellia bacterium]HNG31087.1 ATP-dependent helicase HrpB [Blastocatellia bacterium]
MFSSLPIDSLLPEIVAELRRSPNLIIEAAPGAGKTTRVPAALLDAELAAGEVCVLEPRRLAARMAARRVAEERGEKLGQTVGYQVRFEEVASRETRLRFLTEGVLTRRLLSDPELKNVGVVVLDEFHERHLQADLALALLRRLQNTTRPDLKLVVMSATLNAAPIAAYLGNAPKLSSEGKRFDVAIEHSPREDNRPLAEQVAAAVRRLLAENPDGDVLVFLPGAAEIRRAQAACADLADKHNLLVLPLHGDLSAAEQDRAVKPASQRKIILSTNVAESSVTIDGVVAVIDSGLARVAGHSAWSGLATLNVQRISKASATQRAGRAGRTRSGRCLRLYTAQDFNARADHETAEIHRLDLAEPALELHAAGIADLNAFGWFEAPPSAAVEAADALLRKLGAIDAQGSLTGVGEQMLRFPLHPRQSRMLIEAQSRGVFAEACVLAALIGERDIVAGDLFNGRRVPQQAKHHSPSDLLDRLDLFAEAERANFSASKLREMNLDVGATMAVDRVQRQLLRLPISQSPSPPISPSQQDDALLISILAGYPDRVAKRRSLKDEKAELLLSGGGAVPLSPASSVRQSEFLVAVDAEERRDASANRSRVVRLASAIQPEWLIDLFAEDLRETVEARWNAQHDRVEVSEQMLYDQLVIDERRSPNARGEAVAKVLAEAALSAGWQRFADEEAVNKFLARADFIARLFPESEMPALGEADVQAALTELCAQSGGLRSFSELREAAKGGNLVHQLRSHLNAEQTRLLNQHAPEFVNLAGRRNVRVNYEVGQAPWIASRLQDFFGMTDGPKIAGGRAALVLHLLAPNQRPVQVTTDLAGFWQRTYPQVRRELSRRYPRHQWPENPPDGNKA